MYIIINTRNRIWWWKSNNLVLSESHSGYVFITNYCSKVSYTTGTTALMSIYYRSILGHHYFQTSVDNFQCAPDCLVHHCSNLNKSFLVRCSIAKCLPRIINNLKKIDWQMAVLQPFLSIFWPFTLYLLRFRQSLWGA